jgi:hypothetical protein
MSGTVGAIAISSVKASRHSEGGGGAPCSARFSFSPAACFAKAGLAEALAGASAGRGLGKGTEARIEAGRRPRPFAQAEPSSLPWTEGAGLCAALAGSSCVANISGNAASTAIVLLLDTELP